MKTAMILAAGRGERLKPFTDSQPKALCIVKGKPLIEHHVINLAKAGYTRLIINHAYLGGYIRQYLGNGDRFGVTIDYSPEPPGGLETGGGIVKALPLLGKDPFLAVNADIYTDFDFSDIDLNTVPCAHLILVNKNMALDHFGDFSLIGDHQLSNENPQYIFSGIVAYNPLVFKQCQQGRYSMTPLLRQWTQNNQTSASLYQGLWFDIGSMERLEEARESVLT